MIYGKHLRIRYLVKYIRKRSKKLRNWASDDINVLYPKFKMSESLALYMLCPIRKKGQGYGYAYKWKKEIMEKDSICLPVTDDGSIDFMFMETYISAVKKQVIGRLKDFIAHEKDVYLRAIS